jgi:ubiquinone/menaquinone biosynthesis C-methylase UbiE
MSIPDPRLTEITRSRYQRISSQYDCMEGNAEKRFSPWRKRLWSLVQGEVILEVGVGTGKNMPYYPNDKLITAIDLTPGMLDIAIKRAQEMGINPDLRLADAQSLPFSNAFFDTAIATFVFCSVPNPVLGMREMGRVVKPGGNIFFLEHMRSENPVIGKIMDWVNPVIVRRMGANINRRTVENIREAGLIIDQIEDIGGGGIIKLISAHPL